MRILGVVVDVVHRRTHAHLWITLIGLRDHVQMFGLGRVDYGSQDVKLTKTVVIRVSERNTTILHRTTRGLLNPAYTKAIPSHTSSSTLAYMV